METGHCHILSSFWLGGVGKDVESSAGEEMIVFFHQEVADFWGCTACTNERICMFII